MVSSGGFLSILNKKMKFWSNCALKINNKDQVMLILSTFFTFANMLKFEFVHICNVSAGTDPILTKRFRPHFCGQHLISGPKFY